MHKVNMKMKSTNRNKKLVWKLKIRNQFCVLITKVVDRLIL